MSAIRVTAVSLLVSLSVVCGAALAATTANDQSASACRGDVRRQLPNFSISGSTGSGDTYTIMSLAQHGKLEYCDASGVWRAYIAGTPVPLFRCYFTPATGYLGSDSFTWKKTDSAGVDTNIATFSISVVENTVPVASDSSYSMVQGKVRFMTKLSYTDSDAGQPFSWTLVSAPAHGSMEWYDTATSTHKALAVGTPVPTGYYWYYTPASGFSGTDTFTWRMNDGIVNSNTATVSLTVTANVVPVAYDQKLIAVKGESSVVRPFFSDPDGQTMTCQIVSPPSHGAAVWDGYYFNYTSNSSYTGTDSFTWRTYDGMAWSAPATCRILVRNLCDRSSLHVLLVVKSTLLPEISAEVNRLKADVEAEGYTAEIASFSGTTDVQLWDFLKAEFDTPGQFMAGAILIGGLPRNHGAYTGDWCFWDMERGKELIQATEYVPGLTTDCRDIWVSRFYAGGSTAYGGEATLIKRALQANHDYRTGASRLPQKAWCYDAVNSFENYHTEYLDTWPESGIPGRVMDAFRAGGELLWESSHGSSSAYDGSGITAATLHSNIAQVRFALCNSCYSGTAGGPANNQMLTRDGGNIFSVSTVGVGASDYMLASGAGSVDDKARARLKAGETWGDMLTSRCLGAGSIFDDYSHSSMFYGDLSVRIKVAPANRLPVLNSFTADKASGSAPLSVNFTASASDPDGSIAMCEWFLNGFDYGRRDPDLVSASAGTASHTYPLAHRYQPRVQVFDNYKALVWKELDIKVAPADGQALRVNCGKNLTYYTPAEDYTDSVGQSWLHDQAFISGTWGYSGGSAGLVSSSVAGTAEDVLYQKYRSGASFTYKTPAANGSYALRLGFADMKSTAAGQRVLDVDVEGVAAVVGLDVYAIRGGKNVHVVEIPVDVADGELTFTVRKNAAATSDAFLNCFEVIPGSVTPVAPAITSALIASATVGQPFTYTITASGTTPITFGATNLPAGLTRSGAVISGTPTAAGTKSVTLTATNSAGTDTKTLVITVVTANSSPVISGFSPESPTVVAAGTNQPFTVDAWDADGDTLSYAWKLDGGTVGVTGSVFTYSPTAADVGSHSIEVTVSDGRGGTAVQVWSVTVTVPATPPSIATQPASRTVTAGQTATFSVVAAGTAPLSYQWQKNGTNISGATSASYTTPATTTADNGAKFKVTVTNTAGSVTSNEATLTVNPAPADLPVVTLTAYDAWASEPSSDTGRFRLYRSNCTTTAALTVKYTMSGTATNGSDYQSLTGSVTIAAGSRTAYVYVTPKDDTLVEGAETVTMTLSSDAAYVPGSPDSATVALLDNETPIITVTAGDAYASEPGSDKGSFRVARGGSTAAAVTVKYAMSGTAKNGTDYETLSGSVVIPAGKTSVYVYVTALDDTLVEDQETVVLTVSADASYQVGKTSVATVKLLDDEMPILTVKATDAVAAESSADKGTFTITRSGKLNVALTMTYKMSGIAKSGTDYVAPSGTVTLASGATSATVTIITIDDTLVEGRESVTLALVSSSAYQLGSPSSATLYVYDDEKPYVSITASDSKAYEAGLDQGEFTVSCLPAAKAATTVGLTITGTATSGSDYQALPASVTIAAGASSVKVAVRPVNDAAREGSESVRAALTSGTTYQVGSPSSATVYIISNE